MFDAVTGVTISAIPRDLRGPLGPRDVREQLGASEDVVSSSPPSLARAGGNLKSVPTTAKHCARADSAHLRRLPRQKSGFERASARQAIPDTPISSKYRGESW